MPLKEISEPFLVINSASVSGTTAVIGSISSIKYKDSVAYQLTWSGAPQGIAYVEGSVDYNPGQPQSAGRANPGGWTAITSLTVGSGVTQPALFNLNQLAMPWSRVQFVSSTASGTVTVWFAAKSLG